MRRDILIRFMTALALIIMTTAAYYYLGSEGLLYFGLFCTCFPIFEFAFLRKWVLKRNKTIFIILALFGLIYLSLTEAPMGIVLCLLMVIYICASLLVHRGKKTSNEQKMQTLLYGGFGFIYVVGVPVFALKLISTNIIIFLGLLLIVFTGDVMAYLGGITLGRHKLYEELSPKKSIEGSIFGLLGSVVAGLAWYKIFGIEDYISATMFQVGFVSLLCGVFAQLGDLFESLIKRLSGKKDSGQFLPGHGGFLDRLDGVYFAAPLFYLFTTSFS